MSPADSLVAAAERYLEGRKCVLWADRTIDRPEERHKAAIWLAEQVSAVLVEKAVRPTAWEDVGLVGGK